jgi:hypothetical protein
LKSSQILNTVGGSATSNKNLTDISNTQNQPPNVASSASGGKSYQLFVPQSPPATLELITLFEELLPVIQVDTKSTFAEALSNNLLVNYKVSGKFEVCFINERKLNFKKREFYDVNIYSK